MLRAACLLFALLCALPAPLLAADRTVVAASVAEVADLVSRATPPAVIALRPGEHGVLTLSQLQPRRPIVITTAGDAAGGKRAVLGGIAMTAVANLTFEGIDVHQVSTAETTANSMAIRVVDGARLTFRDMTISGEPAIVGVPPETPAGGLDKTGNIIGLPTGRGVFITGSRDVTLERLDISAFKHGIVLNSSTDLRVLDSEIHDLRTSPLVGGNVNALLVRGNRFHSSRPWAFGGKGDHGDHVHIYTRAEVQSQPNEDITITGNTFMQGDGEAILGVYIDDNNVGIGFKNVRITDNLIHNGHLGGIILEHVMGGVVGNNTLLQSSGDENDAPGIVLAQNSRDIVVKNNITGGLTYAKDQPPSAVTATGNVVVQRHRPDGENYYGDLFVDALKAKPSLQDLSGLPGGRLETLGVGASLTRFDRTPDTLTPVALVDSAPAAKNALSFAFDGASTAAPDGFVDEKDAAFEWDLGDGTRATGKTVSHTYEEPGSYDVTLTVRQTDGTVAATTRTVAASGPEVLALDLDGAATDASYWAHAPVWKGPEAYTAGAQGKAALFTATAPASIEVPARPELGGMEELTISFDIRLPETAAPNQRPLWLQGAYGVEITKDGGLMGIFWLADGTNLRLNAPLRGRGLRDGQWHRVTLAYSAAKGAMTLAVDGREIARQKGGSASIAPTKSTPLVLGSGPFRDPLTGALDRVRMTRAFTPRGE